MKRSFDDNWDIRLTSFDLTKNGVERLAHVCDMNCFKRGPRAILVKRPTRHGPWRPLGIIPRQIIRIVENYYCFTWPGYICLGTNRSSSSLNQSVERRSCHSRHSTARKYREYRRSRNYSTG